MSSTDARLTRSSAARSYPTLAAQSGLARHVGASSSSPTPARAAMAAYPS